MFRTTLAAVAAVTCVLPAAAQPPSRREMQEAAMKFYKNCSSCHRPPDLQFASDAAWTDQLNRTA